MCQASPAWCCGGSSRHRPMSPVHSPSKNSQRLSFDQVKSPGSEALRQLHITILLSHELVPAVTRAEGGNSRRLVLRSTSSDAQRLLADVKWIHGRCRPQVLRFVRVGTIPLPQPLSVELPPEACSTRGNMLRLAMHGPKVRGGLPDPTFGTWPFGAICCRLFRSSC